MLTGITSLQPASFPNISKTQLGNFVNIYSKLLKARSSGNAGEAVSALVMLEKSSQVSSGGWLKRKLGELNEKGV